MEEIDPNCLPPLPVPELVEVRMTGVASPKKIFDLSKKSQGSAFDKSMAFLEIIGDDEWHLIEGRYAKKDIRDIRIDLVEGNLPDNFEPGFLIRDGSLRQITHMHPLSPPTLEGSHNTVFYMHLFHQIPNLLRGLTKEISNLREENQKLKGENNASTEPSN